MNFFLTIALELEMGKIQPMFPVLFSFWTRFKAQQSISKLSQQEMKDVCSSHNLGSWPSSQ